MDGREHLQGLEAIVCSEDGLHTHFSPGNTLFKGIGYSSFIICQKNGIHGSLLLWLVQDGFVTGSRIVTVLFFLFYPVYPSYFKGIGRKSKYRTKA